MRRCQDNQFPDNQIEDSLKLILFLEELPPSKLMDSQHLEKEREEDPGCQL